MFLLDSRSGITRGRTWRHLDSLGVTRFHLVSLGVTRTWCYVTRCHSVSLGFTWCHSVSLGVTRFHLVSLGVTRFHFDLTRFHLVSLGVTFVSLGFTWCHLVSPKPGSHGFSGSFPHDLGLLGVGRSIFFPFKKKRPLGVTWIHFYAKKQVFQEVADFAPFLAIPLIYYYYTVRLDPNKNFGSPCVGVPPPGHQKIAKLASGIICVYLKLTCV